jgi:phospholipid/cholesterol/gamma-HCH transport system permease protein
MKENRFFRLVGGTSLLGQQAFKESLYRPYYPHLIVQQLYYVGVKSVPLVFITAASTGMVMALQFGIGLEKFGGKLYVPKIVSLSIVRELGPVFTCLMLAARIGAGMASEIGSMTVTQQIDAIRALGTSPIKKIVIPRVIACLIAVPLLSAISNMLGVFGGLVVGATDLGLDPHFYFQKVYETVYLPDLFSGLAKTPFFSLFISIPACYYGLNVRGGTQGVGNSTTKSVVTSAILILIGDYFLTKLFLFVEHLL